MYLHIMCNSLRAIKQWNKNNNSNQHVVIVQIKHIRNSLEMEDKQKQI